MSGWHEQTTLGTTTPNQQILAYISVKEGPTHSLNPGFIGIDNFS